MAKQRFSLHFRIPPYLAPRNAWRKLINSEAAKRAGARGVQYGPDVWLEVQVRFYMNDASLRSHDVDNRLKDILDALQGRAGGSKSAHTLPAIIPNDHQIRRVFVEKGLPPKQSGGLGHVIIRKFRGKSKWKKTRSI